MFKHIDKVKPEDLQIEESNPGDRNTGRHNEAAVVLLGADIGGSHISAALANASDGSILEGTFCRSLVDPHADSATILLQWTGVLKEALSKRPLHLLEGIGISMPGPFDYENGISHIDGVSKYNALFGINIRQVLTDELQLPPRLPVVFENDANCFGLGECLGGEAARFERTIGITLGTGLGTAFLEQGNILTSGEGVAPGGSLYNIPFEEGPAEDLLSARGILATYHELSGAGAANVKKIADRALQGDVYALSAFTLFGSRLGRFLGPWLSRFRADCLVIGGSIARSHTLFLPALQQELVKEHIQVIIKISEKMELSSIAGAVALAGKKKKEKQPAAWRLSSQALLPKNVNGHSREQETYDIYPFHPLGDGAVFSGFGSLARWMAEQQLVVLDGYAGIDWNVVREQCSVFFRQQGIRVTWYEASAFLKREAEIEALVLPFMGEPDSVWGKKTTLLLEDLYDTEKLRQLRPDATHTLNILIGTGAALCGWEAPVVYFDLPKNELQYHMRAGSITNLGATTARPPAEMYKRFYFVDWVLLNEHRKKIKDRIAVVADGQWKDDLTWAHYDAVKKGLQHMGTNIIRARPWFEPGSWGGQWLKKHIPSLNQEEVNYAWSFELIVPENGLVFESDGHLLELSFDWLMELDPGNVLGRDAARFGTEFPIRFDFLDTFDGGNLSIQCHPSLSYIQKEFGEKITQDETYYILDCANQASVYLGFQEDIDPAAFRAALENSVANNVPVTIERFVQKFPSHKHDLFLIPNGTVHSSGANNLVLEISATPYIFTFKMYDWLSLDLQGAPRPINIRHAFNNLDFSRKGNKVTEELIPKPVILEENAHYQLVHLPTHKDHFYDVHRIHISGSEVHVHTNDQCHVLMLVEGKTVKVRTGGEEKIFSYAETFIIPAAAGEYTLSCGEGEHIKVIKAFVK